MMTVNLHQAMENLTTRHFLLNIRYRKDGCVLTRVLYSIPRSSCSITDVASHSVILTGGAFFLDGNNYDTTNKVSRYNEDGLVEYMPSLLVGRWRHGCGSFIRDDGNQVSLD